MMDIGRVSLKDLSVFFRQMYVMAAAGMPIFNSLAVVIDSTKSEKMKEVIRETRKEIENGATFSQAVARNPKVFSTLMVSMLEAGEKGGEIESTLSRISAYLEKEAKFRASVSSAVRYPIIVMVTLFAAITLAVAFIIPKFTSMFATLKTELPLPTKILIGMNYVFSHYWWLLLIVIVTSVTGVKLYIKTPKGRNNFDKLILLLPLIGKIVKQVALARFFRMLSDLLKSGVPIIGALDVTASTSDNTEISGIILGLKRDIMGGLSFSEGMKKAGFFPLLSVNMVSIGEKTGDLPDLLVKTADYFEDETDALVANLTTLIEPIIILILAVFVLILALGIFMPMWDMNGMMLKK